MMTQEPIYILTILFGLIFLSEWLCKHTFLKHISSSLLVIILGAVVANLGLIPSASDSSPVYTSIFKYVAPASIFFLLLGVNLKQLRKAGVPMLVAFLLGSFGTMLGVVVALQAIDYESVFGSQFAAIAGMMTGTYTGGSANFNAVALHYEVFREGAIFTGVVVADNIITTVWMIATLSLPVVMQKLRPHPIVVGEHVDVADEHTDREKIAPQSLALMLGLVTLVIYLSDRIAALTSTLGWGIPSVLILTTIALLLAQSRHVQQWPGAKLLGMFSVYLFLVVVGAFCEIGALIEVGGQAIDILIFTFLIVLIHGLFLVGASLLIKADWSIVAIASQANIGGASTALALAKSFDRNDLILPGILAGSLGSGLGTYLGFLVAGLLGA